MREGERHIAGFSIPFVTGTASALYFPVPPYLQPLPGIFITLLTILLIHPVRKKISTLTLTIVIPIVGLLCGIMSGVTAELLSVSHHGLLNGIMTPATDFSKGVKTLIESMPFKDFQTNAIICALIIGDRTGLSQETATAFRDSGASHILALSGMHLGIIYGIMKSILCVLGNSRKSRIASSLIIIFSCGFYTMATGAGPSIVRALIFISLGEIASLTGRVRRTPFILLSALMLQLTFSPMSVKSIGFQLSYAAMAGIAFIYPPLKNLWRHESDNTDDLLTKPMRWIWNSTALSIACQITTGPIAYLYFGTFPTYFMLANLVSIPLVSAIIPVSLLTAALHSIGACPQNLLVLTEMLTSILTDTLEIISAM